MHAQTDIETTNNNDGQTPDAAAVDWHSKFVSGAMSHADVAKLERWLRQSPANADAYARIAALWDGMEPLANSETVRAGLIEAQSLKAGGAKHSLGRFFSKPRRLFAAPAAITLVAAVSIVIALQVLRFGTEDYRTAFGEQRLVELADGSTIMLNTATAVDVEYSTTERRITLVDGQASFDVAHDAAGRPFVVYAGEGRVRAVGTEFDVYKSSDAVTVTLIEGKVEVDSLADRSVIEQSMVEDELSEPIFARAALSPGEQVEIASRGALSPVFEVDVGRIVAWQDGKVNFRDTPLAEAVAEINRYSADKITIADSDLNELRISGVFRIGNSDRFVNALEGFFGVRVERRPRGDIVLSAPV